MKGTLMEDRLCLKMARDSLREIYRSVESGRHTLVGILDRLNATEVVAEKFYNASFFAAILGRLVVLEKELKGEIRAIEEISTKILKDGADERFSEERIAKYRQVNSRLVAIEKRITRDFRSLLPQCEQMQKEGMIDDFEIEAEVSLWLDEKDPAHRDNDDNIMAVTSYNAKCEADSDFGLDDGKNHNECQFFEAHPMQGEHHCWLFHELYDHKELWDDILRADMIWVDVIVRRQNFYYLRQKSDQESGL
jgi:hypothetical protein